MLNFSNTIYLFNYQPTIYRPQGQNKETCKSPNFIDFYKKCVICELHHCLYCFNYLASDPTKTTLGFYESYSLIDEEIKVGCAQCKEGFIFQFSSGQCIYKSQSQQNFLRSFINLDENEICTLSDINDFSIALEILNCQIHILNCKYCIYTLQQTIKSLTCEDGYLVSANTGIRLIPNSKPIRVQINGKCIQCPSLCQVCQERSKEEINSINPYFQITSENLMYTFRCNQKIRSQFFHIDPNLQIAQFFMKIIVTTILNKIIMKLIVIN